MSKQKTDCDFICADVGYDPQGASAKKRQRTRAKKLGATAPNVESGP